MTTPTLELYMFPSCPYCQRVLRVIDELGVEIPTVDIHASREAYKAYAERTGGKTMVPCLFIDGEPMWESLDIAAWLRKTFAAA